MEHVLAKKIDTINELVKIYNSGAKEFGTIIDRCILACLDSIVDSSYETATKMLIGGGSRLNTVRELRNSFDLTLSASSVVVNTCILTIHNNGGTMSGIPREFVQRLAQSAAEKE